MSVELDAEAKAMVKLFSDWDEFNDDYVEELAEAMVSNKSNSPLMSRFERKVENNRTYRDLLDATKAKKAKKPEPFVMQSSGDTKEDVKNTIKGKIKGNKLQFTAKVAKYAKDWNDHSDKENKRLNFFSLNDSKGQPSKTEVKNFNRVAEEVFNKLLSKKGLKV